MSKISIENKKEAKLYMLGIIEGLNRARLSVWGFGFDKDDTALMVRRRTTEEISNIKEILDIDSFGDTMFSSVKNYIESK